MTTKTMDVLRRWESDKTPVCGTLYRRRSGTPVELRGLVHVGDDNLVLRPQDSIIQEIQIPLKSLKYDLRGVDHIVAKGHEELLLIVADLRRTESA